MSEVTKLRMQLRETELSAEAARLDFVESRSALRELLSSVIEAEDFKLSAFTVGLANLIQRAAEYQKLKKKVRDIKRELGEDDG